MRVRRLSGGTAEALLSPVATCALVDRFSASPERIGGPHRGLLPTLTDRDRESAGLVARWLSNQPIAERLFLGPLTVRFHVYQAITMLGARTEPSWSSSPTRRAWFGRLDRLPHHRQRDVTVLVLVRPQGHQRRSDVLIGVRTGPNAAKGNVIVASAQESEVFSASSSAASARRTR
jgi:DNA-binding CsgD family transcriptional regulator